MQVGIVSPGSFAVRMTRLKTTLSDFFGGAGLEAGPEFEISNDRGATIRFVSYVADCVAGGEPDFWCRGLPIYGMMVWVRLTDTFDDDALADSDGLVIERWMLKNVQG